MQLLLAERPGTQRSLTATVVSAALPAGPVVVLALSGRQVVNSVRFFIEESVQYLYQVPREIGTQRPGQENESAFRKPRTFGATAPRLTDAPNGDGRTAGLPHAGAIFTPDPSNVETEEPGIGDNAFSIVDVDSVATVDPTSAAPEYPSALVQRRVEGVASFRFVVDSTGLIDMSTVRVLASTHKLFAQAVLDAMPRMKFRPARAWNHAVRLLVEQSFMLKIARAPGHVS
jgi:TonB family protein